MCGNRVRQCAARGWLAAFLVLACGPVRASTVFPVQDRCLGAVEVGEDEEIDRNLVRIRFGPIVVGDHGLGRVQAFGETCGIHED